MATRILIKIRIFIYLFLILWNEKIRFYVVIGKQNFKVLPEKKTFFFSFGGIFRFVVPEGNLFLRF